MLENILKVDSLVRASDQVQFEALWRARKLAAYLIVNPEKIGEVRDELIKFYGKELSLEAHLLYGEHQIAIIDELCKNPSLWKSILHADISFEFPTELLQLDPATKIQQSHASRMLLSACLFPIRQSIGSCFATAPAMTVQRFCLKIFVDDCLELMQKGRLKRVFQGDEYTAPLCAAWQQQEGKDVEEHALCKAWEYTIASFCEYKVEFYKWNLFAALGFDPEQSDGIGALIYALVKERLDQANQAILERQRDVESAYGQMKTAENFFRDATSYSQARRHRSEHLVGSYQFKQSLEERDQALSEAENYAQFFNYLTDQYQQLFETYFQEVFDPKIIDVNQQLFADSPAGFRLVYKHGRKISTKWTLIHSEGDYIQALQDFFRMAETELIFNCEWEQGKKAISTLTTQILHHLETEEFIKSAKIRVKGLHKKAQTGAIHLTPWSYLSGGSMEHLLRCYFSVENPIVKEEKIVKSPTDLLIFLIETLKSAPPAIAESHVPLFAYSPTHAFRLMPGWKEFKEAWMSKEFTYTWVRDHWVLPGEEFFFKQKISLSEQRDVLKALGIEQSVSQESLSLTTFRSHIINTFPGREQDIDSLLIQCKPGIQPFFIGDTNWPGLFFAFAVNPGTMELDLWRTDPAFKAPRPMHMWRHDLNGASQKPWGVFLHKFF